MPDTHLLTDLDVIAPSTMGESFDRLAEAGLLTPEVPQRLRKTVGFRNIAIHNYQAVDWRIVHSICQDRLGDFKAFAAQTAEHLLDR